MKYRRSRLEPLEKPTGPSKETEKVNEALKGFPDPRYPGHDEEKFQEGYPKKGDGKYGSPGKF